ncbi:MAG: polyribonucleotide nucleotidyltransferase, partial [Terrimesophilobacter sp.]
MEGPEIKFAEAVLDNGKFGKRTVRFETGRLAQQAQGAVAAYLDEDTMLLSATSAGKYPKDNFDFFPLTVDVEERSYAAGKIPGSFFRREGRPSTEAILVCRLIDRPLRPSFVDGLRNEVQIVITVLSIAPGEFYDALAINAASASTLISGLPFSGPVAGIRMALIPGSNGTDQWVAFPKFEQLQEAVFDLTVAGRIVTDKNGKEDVAIMMVEAEATEHAWELIKAGATKPNEAIVAQGLEAAKPFLAQLVKAQAEMGAQAAKEIQDYPVFPPYEEATYNAVAALAETELSSIYKIAGKVERQNADDELKARVKVAIAAKVEAGELPEGANNQLSAAYKSVTKKVVRSRILTEGVRMDGRGLADIRPLDSEVQVIPRVHGSAIFQRGETQILGVTTLNMLKMEQQIDSLAPVTKKRYMHHYNFPPYSTGETGRVGSPKRREIGHGFLAERAIMPVLPSREEFPYAIRQVSEALSSNGSTSMGSVCASTLSL